MALKSLSLRGYARHRKELGLPGGSLQSVQRAIENDRISFVIEKGVKRIADPEAADREWSDNTDHTRAPGYVRELADGEDGDEQDEEGGPSLSKASAREKHWKAELAELSFRRKAGELVEVEAVQAAVAEDYGAVRTLLLGLSTKVKQKLPHLSFGDLATIGDLVREALEEVAEPPDLAAVDPDDDQP